MIRIRKLLTLYLCACFLLLQMPAITMAQYYAEAKKGTGVTVKQPQSLSSPEEAIPVVEVPKEEKKAKEEKKGSKKWWYIGAGVVVLGLIAALAMGGGGGGGGNDDLQDPNGGIAVSW